MIKVRFAPSPTGKLHLGSARTAIFNWLYAKHCKGKFILRIEDTDLNRSDPAFIDSIIKDMQWLGMDYDEFYRQSERFDIYRKYIDMLINDNLAYYCTCSKEDLVARNKARGIFDETTKYDGHCRDNVSRPNSPYVVRINIGEERDIIFKDLVRERIRVNTKELDDYVLWKSDDSPTYNFAVVIDDVTMEISHILRGEDHITNTAKQIVLYEYLNMKPPAWGHLPLVFGKDRSPLSKRKGGTNIEDYRKSGILPDALINYIARLGWSHGNDEIFTINELIEYFDTDKLNKANAVYDEEKMRWVNGKHLKIAEPEKLLKYFDDCLEESGIAKTGLALDKDWLTKALIAVRERNYTLEDIYNEIKAYTQETLTIEDAAETKLNKLYQNPSIQTALKNVITALSKIPNLSEISDNETQTLESDLRQIAEKHEIKFGNLVQVMRIKLTGKTVSPDIITVIKLLGDNAIKRLSE
jgi:glutamyl-tRNA synthetase